MSRGEVEEEDERRSGKKKLKKKVEGGVEGEVIEGGKGWQSFILGVVGDDNAIASRNFHDGRLRWRNVWLSFKIFLFFLLPSRLELKQNKIMSDSTSTPTKPNPSSASSSSAPSASAAAQFDLNVYSWGPEWGLPTVDPFCLSIQVPFALPFTYSFRFRFTLGVVEGGLQSGFQRRSCPQSLKERRMRREDLLTKCFFF